MGIFSRSHRKWPTLSRRAIIWLMPFELVGLIAVLVIFSISQPDLYRTKMWQIGFENKLNSNPNMILYAYANFKPLPNIPLICLTNFNVAISVVSLFFLLAKLIAFIMKLWLPLVATFVNMGLLALYTVSVYGQIGPDYADPRYPAPAAWYIRYGCGLAKRYGIYKSCQIARGSLGATFHMQFLYILNLGLSLYAMWPNRTIAADDDEDAESMQSTPNLKGTEMQSFTSAPFTPRTQGR